MPCPLLAAGQACKAGPRVYQPLRSFFTRVGFPFYLSSASSPFTPLSVFFFSWRFSTMSFFLFPNSIFVYLFLVIFSFLFLALLLFLFSGQIDFEKSQKSVKTWTLYLDLMFFLLPCISNIVLIMFTSFLLFLFYPSLPFFIGKWKHKAKKMNKTINAVGRERKGRECIGLREKILTYSLYCASWVQGSHLMQPHASLCLCC